MKIFENIRTTALAAVALAALGVGGVYAAQLIQDNLTVSGTIQSQSGELSINGLTASPRNINVGGTAAQLAADGNDSTPAATEVYIGEMWVPTNITPTGACVMNGSVASGNFKVGVADGTSGVVLATSASTAMVGTDLYQCAAFVTAPTLIGPKSYDLLLIYDNATARYNTFAVGKFGASKQTGQVYATGFTTITPPTTFTTALAPIGGLY